MWLPAGFSHPLLAWLFQTTWQVALLVALVWLLRLVLGAWLAPRWRCALWLVVAVRLLMPAAPPSPMSMFSLLDALPAYARSSPRTVLPLPPLPATREPRLEAQDPRGPYPVSIPVANPGITTAWWWLGLWALGALCSVGWVLVVNLRLARRLAALPEVDDPATHALLARCSRRLGLGRPPRAVEVDARTPPAVTGLRRTTLLLPAGLNVRLRRDELEHVLMHELMHVKRHDIAVHWLFVLLRAIHWFNPAVWMAVAGMQVDREFACDAAVLRLLARADRRSYGEAIVAVLRDTGPRAAPGVSLGKGRTLDRRLIMIRRATHSDTRPDLPGVVVLIAVALVALTRPDSGLAATVPSSGTQTVGFVSAGAALSPFAVRWSRGATPEPRPDTRLTGLLRRPAGAGPHPAAVFVSGCRGIEPYQGAWADLFVKWGFVVLQLDSLGARGADSYCDGTVFDTSLQAAHYVPDAYAALDYLRRQDFVDPNRVVLVGWGPWATLASVLVPGYQQFFANKFRTAVAFYPDCGSTETGDFYAPVLVLVGGDDDWTPAAKCAFMQRNGARRNRDITVATYPGVGHGFDNPGVGARKYYPAASNLYRSPARGATVGYDAAAHANAIARVRTFLDRELDR